MKENPYSMKHLGLSLLVPALMTGIVMYMAFMLGIITSVSHCEQKTYKGKVIRNCAVNDTALPVNVSK